mmetsp:Transcript_3839/g.6506  ORF Transcript_3839/g.6506 Transcript_3839/m.6506 type:complete len:317 (+) Transcript_3839:74-1024(+)
MDILPSLMEFHTAMLLTSFVITITTLALIWRHTISQRVHITAIYVYPIKSCRGISMTSSEICQRGFKYDRMFAMIDEKGDTISLRCHPRMALISTQLLIEDDSLLISHPDLPSMRVSLSLPGDGEREVAKVWDDEVAVREVSTAASTWVCTALAKTSLRLVRIVDDFIRQNEFSPDGQTGLADELPFMMASEESLQALNTRLKKAVTMANFRPNIVVGGCGAFAEDKWTKVLTGGMELTVTKPCSRCSLPNIDPQVGVRDNSFPVTKALREFRLGRHLGLREEWSDTPFFGVQMDNKNGVTAPGVKVCVGDSLTLF